MKQPTLPQELLERAYKYVQAGWTQGVNAVNAEGKSVYDFDPSAVKWCAMGAIGRAGADIKAVMLGNPRVSELDARYETNLAYYLAINRLQEIIGDRATGVASFNDTVGRTQAEVLQVLKSAAESFAAE
ncbi:MAG TPA: hypothetical protein VHL10_10180 [Nitrososphaera sp.]|jgi:hypothetical protein|nr:hypothetical protein [Nitrososphaera sp.]